jgi:hypothetical protein
MVPIDAPLMQAVGIQQLVFFTGPGRPETRQTARLRQMEV